MLGIITWENEGNERLSDLLRVNPQICGVPRVKLLASSSVMISTCCSLMLAGINECDYTIIRRILHLVFADK